MYLSWSVERTTFGYVSERKDYIPIMLSISYCERRIYSSLLISVVNVQSNCHCMCVCVDQLVLHGCNPRKYLYHLGPHQPKIVFLILIIRRITGRTALFYVDFSTMLHISALRTFNSTPGPRLFDWTKTTQISMKMFTEI